jgi:hypothetical protein
LRIILGHLERHDMNLVLVRIHLGLQGDVVPFMPFYRNTRANEDSPREERDESDIDSAVMLPADGVQNQ